MPPPLGGRGAGAPSAASADRTAEFMKLAAAAQAARAPTPASAADNGATLPGHHPSLTAASTSSASGSEFSRKAAAVGAGIHATSAKLAQLAALAKRTSSFDDPAAEIADLSARIKRDIAGLNGALAELATLGGRAAGDGHARAHSHTVVDSLRSRLKDAASQFKGVLDARQAALAAGADRRARFSAPSSAAGAAGTLPPRPPALGAARAGGPLFGGPAARPPPPGLAPPPQSNERWGGAGGGGAPPPPPTHFGAATGGQPLRQRGGRADDASQPLLASRQPPGPPVFGGGQAQAQALAPQRDAYLHSRAGALQQVESTIAELGGIFNQLATLVAEQGETAIRIDEHVSDALGNVEGAQAQLLRHLATISSNRWLILKCLGVLLVFALFFVFVVA